MIKERRKIFIAISMVFALLISTTTAWGITKSVDIECSVTFKLPATLERTNFSSSMLAVKEENNKKVDYQFKGTPFLMNNQTYVPTRDVAEAFGISVLYNTQDRAVRLLDDEKELIIMPQIEAYGRTMRSLKLPSNETDSTGYILINNMSYVPLRFILEYFSFHVDYVDKQITISGKMAADRGINDFFDGSTYDIVTKAFSGYEGAKTVSFKGLYEGESITATLNKASRSDHAAYQYTIDVSEKHYKAEAIGYSNGEGSYWTDAPFDPNSGELHIGGHPFAYIADNSHFGILKYTKHEHVLINEDEKVLKYQIVNNNYYMETVEISKETGKLVRISARQSDGTVTKDLAIQY